ncbi:MAG: bestrophin family ion channel, partial [Bacteroidota bacterium]
TAFVIFLYDIFGLTFIQVPWTPVALIGTALAFMIGFQNNAAYGRIWEARKIWGGIVNNSRTWGMKIKDMISNEHNKGENVSEEELNKIRLGFIYRQIAWLISLRYAMRQPRRWEVFREHRTNREWSDMIHIPEQVSLLEDNLMEYLTKEEMDYINDKTNKPAAILFLQSKNLRIQKERGLIWQFSFLNLENTLQEFFNLQGKSERIKNFPYPRQYATLSHFFIWIFVLFLPFGIVPEFSEIGEKFKDSFPLISDYFVWTSIPFIVLVKWVFHTMERIGRVGENPFEGSSNDVPISTISRGVEIDLLQLFEVDKDMIPAQFPEEYNVQM